MTPRGGMRPSGLPRDLIVCRCEEVSVGQVEDLVFKGVADPNQIKRLCRIGMGLCQGRTCGLLLESIVFRMTGIDPSELGFLTARPPLRPVPLAQLSEAEDIESDEFADPH